MSVDLNKVDEVISEYGNDPGGLIPVLLKVQDLFNYLPIEATDYVAEKMGVSKLQIETVVNFYKNFYLDPRGQNIVKVCDGTACRASGGELLIDHLSRVLGIKPGQTSRDMLFTVETMSCQGMCSLGPVMIVNGKLYGNMTPAKLDEIIEPLQRVGDHE